MASISREPDGRKRIQFALDGRRCSIRLGKASVRIAETVRTRIEHLIAAQITGSAVDDETNRWLASIDNELRNKLAKYGLAERRSSAILGAFVDSYIVGRTDVKDSTLTTYRRAEKKLLGFFDVSTSLRDIRAGDADDFERWLRNPSGGALSEATARKTVSIAKQMFRTAARKKIIQENPFADLSGVVPANRDRDYFITQDEAALVFDACPDVEWRLLFALSRYGGLRCPSEHLAMLWSDVDWADNRMTIRSPKTEHHQGGASRLVPIFPELRPYLLEAFEQADDGAKFVIARYRRPNANLRTQLLKIITRAGLKPWPKLFQNLRATRETELAEDFPAHVVSAWIGNSERVAAKHYLQVTDEHFERAVVQNPAQQPAATACNEPHGENVETDKCSVCGDLHDLAALCISQETGGMGDTGLEPVTSTL